jgi:hypothetical protein
MAYEDSVPRNNDLDFQMSFLIRSAADAERLVFVFGDWADADNDNYGTDRLSALEKLVALWDTDKPTGWLNAVLSLLGESWDIVNETAGEIEYITTLQLPIQALGFAAKRLYGLDDGWSPLSIPPSLDPELK